MVRAAGPLSSRDDLPSLHHFGGEGLLPHVGGGGVGGGGEVALLLVGRLLEHLGGEAEDPHLVPLCDSRGPANIYILIQKSLVHSLFVRRLRKFDCH